MRLARVIVTTHNLEELLIRGGYQISGLPEGARLLRWFTDPPTSSIHFVFEHESFAEVEDGKVIPEINLTVK